MSREGQGPAEDLNDIWVQHASVIRGLYLQRQPRLSLREVRNIMMKDHAFPDFKMSTWETKLRDKLGLRKKMRKTDWPIVWRHCVQRGHRGKRSAVYLQGVRVPSQRAWAEIRRQDARTSAQLNNEPLPVLPTGVEVRTPPPNSPGIPIRAGPDCLVSQRPRPNEIGQSTGEIETQEASLPTFCLRDLVAALDGISFQSRECLASLPWNNWMNSSRSAVSGSICEKATVKVQDIPPTFMEYVVMKLSPSTIATSTPLITLAHYVLNSKSNHQIASHFDTYYYLAWWLYMFSNRLYRMEGDDGSGPPFEKLRQFLTQLISNIPQRVFSAVLNIRFPSIHAAWDGLMVFICLVDTKEEFSYLIECGLNNIDWILPYRHELLIYASRFGCSDMIMRLLSIGASTEVILGIRIRHVRDYTFSSPTTALLAAVEGRHAHCFQLVLENCDINKDCYSPWLLRERWDDCDFCFNQAPGSVFYHFLRKYSLVLDDFNCEIMGILLEAGADVDAVAPCNPRDFDTRTPVSSSGFLPRGLHTTIVESTFYWRPHFFNELLRYSRVGQGQVSQARLLQAAVEGCGALEAYLQTLTADKSEVNWHLESCLAKAFSYKATPASSFLGTRIQVIHNLLLSGVDPTFPSSCGVLSIQCMLNIMLIWGRDSIVEQDEPLPQCFTEVTQQLLRHGALWDEVDWNNVINRDSLGILPMLDSLGVDFKSLDGRALSYAAAAGNLEAVRWLLDAGVNVNATWTASDKLSNILLYAIEHPFQPAVLQLLLQHGARLPVEIRGKQLIRLLQSALQTYLSSEGNYPRARRDFSGNFYLGMIEVILSLGPDLSRPDAGDPDLFEACFIVFHQLGEGTDCCLAAFDLLLEKGAPITSSALAALIGLGGRSDLVKQLIQTGSDVHSYAIGRREVLLTCEDGQERMNHLGFSPVQAAVYRNNPEQITLLLENGADINQPAFNDFGRTALQAACTIEGEPGKHWSNLRMVKFLLELGADADSPPAQKNGFTALQIAASKGDLEIVLILLHWGADPNRLDTADWRAGRTALDYAAEQGRLDILQLLLAFGARSGSPGQTGIDGAIELAQEDQFYAIVKYLEDHAKSRSGSSPDFPTCMPNLGPTTLLRRSYTSNPSF